jgi:hypothetical protein
MESQEKRLEFHPETSPGMDINWNMFHNGAPLEDFATTQDSKMEGLASRHAGASCFRNNMGALRLFKELASDRRYEK